MPKSRSITRAAANARPTNMTLNLECFEEPLSEAQLTLRAELKENYDRVLATLEELIKDHGGKLVCQSGSINGYQYSLPMNHPQAIVKNTSQAAVNVSQNKSQSIKLNVLNNSNGPPSNIQLVVDPRMGVILGSVAQTQGTTTTTVSAAVSTSTSTPVSTSVTASSSTHSASENYKYTRSGRRTKVLQLQQTDVIEELTPVTRGRQKSGGATHVVTPTTTSPQGVTNLKIKTVTKQQVAPAAVGTVAVTTTTAPPLPPPPQLPTTVTLTTTTTTLATVMTITTTTTTTTTTPTPSTASTDINARLPLGHSIARPTEHTSIGGISVGKKNAASEQIDESKKNLPDGREITFNKINGGRTFPSLVVLARPNLRTKDILPQIAQKERSELDMKVKSVLMFSATKFAEWLIQQGLVRSEQYCAQHSKNYQKTKLKLGMYSDHGTFPYSGGYVWISSCCPDRFVSVFSGSIFQGAPYTPTVLLKLIYHWACQTNVQNVVSWVKVSNVYVKNFYTNLRSVCTAATWDKTRKMGGKNSMIQVGVISLGTTSQDGNLRQVKVEVLGVLDLATLDLRLRACDPVQDGERACKRRFNNILHPLKEWVHTDSKIMTDFTVDKSTLQEMGFSHVTQSAFSDQNPRNFMSNYHIMEYLRKIVPRMFQNTLSLLSRQMIQQFLDELVWREMHGSTAARAFDNIILHIAEQTRIDSNESLLDRLAKIASNPFQDWSYSNVNLQNLTAMTVPNEQSQLLSDVSSFKTNVNASASSSSSITTTTATTTTTSTSTIACTNTSTNANAIVNTDTNINIVKQQQHESLAQTTKPGPKRGRKRMVTTRDSPEPDVKKLATDSKNTVREKDKGESKNDQQIQLQEFYYATMEGDKALLLKEYKTSLYFRCFLCTKTMRSNTDVMEHMIGHVPPQVPGQSESPVCRYCCTAFSSQHQMLTHVTESHSNFGHSDSDMVVCAICEQKFGNSGLLVNHLSSMHYPSEMPYKCDACGYRTSSHKDAIDHFYGAHEKGEGLQCPYCLKVIQFVKKAAGDPVASNVHAFLLHMQRHVIRREQGRGNKCSRCCLWFNQKSSLKIHQRDLHDSVSDSRVIPYSSGNISNGIMISKQQRSQYKRFDVDSPVSELLRDERLKKWLTGPLTVNAPVENLSCQECEEDIDEDDHFPGEQKCQQCRYLTCCWRAFRDHQQQVHNERPMTGIIVPSPLLNIPLDKRMQCSCGFATLNGNQLASHLIKCNKFSAYPEEGTATCGMLDSLGLVPKNSYGEETVDLDKRTNLR